MKHLVLLVHLALLLLTPAASAMGQGHGSLTTEPCGQPVDGIALCLSPFLNRSATVEIRNPGPKDAVLNLGIMLANGRRQYATAITRS